MLLYSCMEIISYEISVEKFHLTETNELVNTTCSVTKFQISAAKKI